MRIAIDGQGLAGNLTGAGKALTFLLRQFRLDFPQHEWSVFVPSDRRQWNLPRQLFWDQIQFTWLALRAHADILHAPNGTSAPILRHRRLLMTVHDMAPTRHPEFLPHFRSRWYWGRWIPFTARLADRVLVPSVSTKRDLIELARIPERRIRVIPYGVPLDRPEACDSRTIEMVRSKYELPDQYILYVGTIDRRKDYRTLLQAFSCVTQPTILVLVGTLIKGRTDFPELVEHLGLAKRVRLLGYVPDSDLAWLYQGAGVFVYPSAYEGFGLPVLEAMACRTPVITYNTTSLPEVVGEAGILLDPPVTPEVLAAHLVRLLEDETLRRELVDRGQEQARRFNWQRTARLTLSAYEELMS